LLTAVPRLRLGPPQGRPDRPARVRACLGCAEGSQSDAVMFTEMTWLPRYARLAIEARPLGRARAGPRRSRGI